MIILRKLSQIHPDIPLVWKLFSESFHEHERIIFSDLLDIKVLETVFKGKTVFKNT